MDQKYREEKEMKANAKFTFHNVGQGMFYTGDIIIDKNNKQIPFRFVYDCGASPGVRYLKEAINRYAQDIKQHSPSSRDKKLLSLICSLFLIFIKIT